MNAVFILPLVTYSGLLISHEDSVAGEVVAGTGCVCVVGV